VFLLYTAYVCRGALRLFIKFSITYRGKEEEEEEVAGFSNLSKKKKKISRNNKIEIHYNPSI
jgi:hypothetical protein